MTTASRLHNVPTRFHTDGTQLCPGWYKLNHKSQHRKVDNRVASPMRCGGPRIPQPVGPATKKAHVGPGAYEVGGLVPDINKGSATILNGNRWVKNCHMAETEAAKNSELAPAKYHQDQYHQYSQGRCIEQGNRTASRRKVEAHQQEANGLRNGGAGGSLLLTSEQRIEQNLNSNRPALDVMASYWDRGGVMISTCPRFNWQRGPQSHTLLRKSRPTTAAGVVQNPKIFTKIVVSKRPATSASIRKPKQQTVCSPNRPKASFVRRQAPAIGPVALSPAFKQPRGTINIDPLKYSRPRGDADCRGNPWSFFESETIGRFAEN